MTEIDLKRIEKELGFAVPDYYRATMLNYPFGTDSFADDCMLPSRPDRVIELVGVDSHFDGIEQPFFVGTDGGEEWYFVDSSKPDSGVFVFQLETGKHESLSPSWNAYLEHIRAIDAEGAADEAAELERKRNKKWWQFWI